MIMKSRTIIKTDIVCFEGFILINKLREQNFGITTVDAEGSKGEVKEAGQSGKEGGGGAKPAGEPGKQSHGRPQ